MLDKVRTPTGIPANQNERIEADTDQTIQLTDASGGDDPNLWIGGAQRPEPFHNSALRFRIKFIKSINQQQRSSTLECLLDETRQTSQIKHGCTFGCSVGNDIERVFGWIEWKLQICDVI